MKSPLARFNKFTIFSCALALAVLALGGKALAMSPEVTDFERDAEGRVTVTWSSVVGVEYRLQFSPDLSEGSFEDVIATVANAESTTIIHSPGTTDGFYRIVFPFVPEREPIALYGDSYIDGSSGPPAPDVRLEELTGATVIEEGNDGETALQISARFAAGPHTGMLAAMLDQPSPGFFGWTPEGVAESYASFRDAVTRADGNYIAVIPANRRPYDGTNWGTSESFIDGTQQAHEELRDLLVAQHAPDRVFDWWRWATRSYVPQDSNDFADMTSNGESIIPRSLRNSAGGDRNGDHLNAAGHAWMAEGLYQAYLRLEDPTRFTATDKVTHFYPLDAPPTVMQVDVVGDQHGELQGGGGVLTQEDGKFGKALEWSAGDTIRVVTPHLDLGDEFAFDLWVRPDTDGTRVFQMFGGGGGILLLTSGNSIRFRAGALATEVSLPYSVGAWNHVYCQVSNGQMSIRVNGGAQQVKSLPSMELGNDLLFIGSNNSGSSNFTGRMHSLAFYGTLLSEDEVQQRYNGGNGERLPGL
jgi:hypothetical protein